MVEEQSRPGRLRDELVYPIVRRNLSALKESGVKVPMKAMAVIKNLPEGSSFTFPDGTVVSQSEAVEPPRAGRKVVVCGDTADARAIAGEELVCELFCFTVIVKHVLPVCMHRNFQTSLWSILVAMCQFALSVHRTRSGC